MRCIFCLTEKPPSDEHVFPDSIGGKLVINRVCLPCNNWLGAHVDALLTDHVLILLKRAQLGMCDSKGNVIDPWKKVFHYGTLVDNPDQKVRVAIDSETGRPAPQLIYKKSILDNGTVQISIDAQQVGELGKMIQRERTRNRLPLLSDDVLQVQIEVAKNNSNTIENPMVLHEPQIDTRDYHRAIYKIAYELAWLWLGDEYLDDPVAMQLRNAVIQNASEGIKGTIELNSGKELFSLWDQNPIAHIGLGKGFENNIVISIRIFDSIFGVIVVSETRDKYPIFCGSPRDGGFVLNDPLTGALRNSPWADELHRITLQRISERSPDAM